MRNPPAANPPYALIVVTNNAREFGRMPGVGVEDWV
jgi:predicted nucleic acid-binding protein